MSKYVPKEGTYNSAARCVVLLSRILTAAHIMVRETSAVSWIGGFVGERGSVIILILILLLYSTVIIVSNNPIATELLLRH